MVRAVTPIPFVKARFFDRCGKPLVGGKVYTYEANTTTPKVTYKDPYGLTPNTNPIILDAAGEADIYLDGTYRIRITDRNDVLVNDVEKIGSWFSDNLQDTLDNISGAMDDALKPILQNLDNAINTAAAAGAGANGWTADLIADKSGATQQQVNYNGGSKWHSRVGGYQENERVVLSNGDIVKSTIDGNTNDPNVDMTGWEYNPVNLRLNTISNSIKRTLTEVIYDQIIDVTWFGAIGNWNKDTQTGHNSTTAVKNAIAYLATLGTRRAGGKRGLKFPKGSFRVDYMDLPAALSFGIDIIGDGLCTTTLYFDQNQTREAIKCEIELVQFIGMTLVGSLNEVRPVTRTAGFVGRLPDKRADIDVKFLDCSLVYWNTFAQIYGRGCIFENCTVGLLTNAMEIVVTPDQVYSGDNNNQTQSEWATMRHYVFRNCRFDYASRAYKISGSGSMLEHINNMLFVGNDIMGMDILVDAETAEISNSLFAANTALASFSSAIYKVKAFHATSIVSLISSKVVNYDKALTVATECTEIFVLASAPCSNLTISGNTVRGIRRGVFVNTSLVGSRNITISNNQLPDFGTFRGGITQTAISNQSANCKNLVIVGNNCETKTPDNNFYLFNVGSPQLASDVTYANNSANFTWRDAMFTSNTIQVYVAGVASTGVFTSRLGYFVPNGDYIEGEIGISGTIPEASGVITLGLPVVAVGSMPAFTITVSGSGSVISAVGIVSLGYTWATAKVNPATQRIELQKQKDLGMVQLNAADIPADFSLVISFKYKFK